MAADAFGEVVDKLVLRDVPALGKLKVIGIQAGRGWQSKRARSGGANSEEHGVRKRRGRSIRVLVENSAIVADRRDELIGGGAAKGMRPVQAVVVLRLVAGSGKRRGIDRIRESGLRARVNIETKEQTVFGPDVLVESADEQCFFGGKGRAGRVLLKATCSCGSGCVD